jgi:hypothetical protein
MFVLIFGKHRKETADRIEEAMRIEREFQLKEEGRELSQKIRNARAWRKKQ